MIVLKIALGILAAGILEFLGLFLWCLFMGWKHSKKDIEDKPEI